MYNPIFVLEWELFRKLGSNFNTLCKWIIVFQIDSFFFLLFFVFMFSSKSTKCLFCQCFAIYCSNSCPCISLLPPCWLSYSCLCLLCTSTGHFALLWLLAAKTSPRTSTSNDRSALRIGWGVGEYPNWLGSMLKSDAEQVACSSLGDNHD